jgi:S-DNA-T family DNA segregation ATPase FtsK/SpoIIIE
MSGYRKMRRSARQARRAGMQPMMVLNSGDPFPELAVAVFARWLWRYRSELAPAGVACLLEGLGWYAHAALFHWWWLILAACVVVAWLLGGFGAKIGIPAFLERLYAAGTVLAGGTWVSLAAVAGPLAPPLPLALGIGGLVLAVPWWANRRRRAKVRVERAIAAWPDIARAIGLAGSEITSATVDLWGWRARLRLARGQTITDVMAKAPGIESGLGTHRNAVRVSPTPDDLANRCELRILDRDPHADAIAWPGPSVTSITQPIDLGPFEDAEECRVSFLRRHALIGGATGSGKSGGLNGLMANLAACRDVVIWGIDLKRGMELKPWEPCLDRLATTPGAAARMLEDAVAILLARADSLASIGRREWQPSPQAPALVIIIDEYAELAEQSPSAMTHTDSIARLGRAVAVTLVAATQRPTQKVMGQGAVRSQMDVRVSFRVREQRDVDLILGQGMRKAGWQADKLNAPGKFLISAPGHDIPRRARAYLITDDDVRDTVARCAPARPELDQISDDARFAGLRTQPPSSGGSSPEDERPSGGDPGETAGAPGSASLDDALWAALCAAHGDGADIGELMRATGMGRSTIYRYLSGLARDGRAEQVGWGRWRAIISSEGGDDA